MSEEIKPEENEAVDDNGAIREECERRQEFLESLYDLDNELRPHGHSVASLFKDFALRLHGIRV